MMGYEAPLNILSPESRVLEFKVPSKAGFYVFPHSDVYPSGWGEPFQDSHGNPVPEPGTPGGDNPIKFLSWNIDDSAWESNRTPGSQLYGNIDWLGPPLSSENPKDEERVRLSYWGPQSRHFASPSFVYGSDPKHEEIYRNGLYLSVAPYPVLGAAIMVDELPPPEGVSPPPPPVLGDWLVVVCRVGLDCKVYSRLIPSSSYSLVAAPEVLAQVHSMYNVHRDSMTAALRERIQSRYDSSLNPYGWIYVGTIYRVSESGKEGLAPNTPWFFNESGDVAQCVQDISITFDNGVDASKVELGKEIRAILFSNYRTFVEQTIPNLGGFTYEATCVKESEPHIEVTTDSLVTVPYTFPSCIGEYWNTAEQLDAHRFHWQNRSGGGTDPTHYLAVDHVRNETTVTGSYVVGVDYYEDTEIYIYLRYDCYMSAEKWWRYCIDRVIVPTYESGGLYTDPASDGAFFQYWAWWDETTGDLIETLENAVFDSPYANLDEYLANGGSLPPQGPFDGRLGSYHGMNGRVWLEWTHPVTGLHTQNLYWGGTFANYLINEGDRGFVPGEDPDFIQYFNYLQFFDIRHKQGPLASYYQERYTKTLADQGNLGLDVLQIYYDLEYVNHPDTQNQKPQSFMDARKADENFVRTDTSIPGQLCDMLVWNPTGAEDSVNEALTTVFARKDFSWNYTVTQYEGVYVPQEDFDTANLEPSPQYWHEDNGWNFYPWPAWRDLVSNSPKCVRQGSMSFSGDRYLFSLEYIDQNEEVAYFNYITDGGLESLVNGATRFYPAIGT